LAADFTRLVNAMKKAGLDAVEASSPVNAVFGEVISAAPLKIKVEQKMTLEAPQLVLTRNVTTHRIDMTVDHVTEPRSGGTGDASFESHSHQYAGRKTFTVHNALEVGDEVVMLRAQGGQKYIVVDRLG
jgi:hypothetical protein